MVMPILQKPARRGQTDGGTTIEVIATPGHTLDMLATICPTKSLFYRRYAVFAGVWAIFEGDAAMMWDSLSKLIAQRYYYLFQP